ncbi:MAG: hypothetical protein HY744_05650 [Deltaproteobacteria bacterium]|nr:hypothetical protein [Deltaproteobacteria bacterium]
MSEAGALADSAFDLMKKGMYREAVELFRKADERYHSPMFVLHMARATAKLGDLVGARALLAKAVEARLGAGASAAFREAQAEAKSSLSDLDRRIPKVEVRLVGAVIEDTTIKIDGQEVARSALGSPIRVNPGSHRIEVVAPSGKTSETSFSVVEGETAQVELGGAEGGGRGGRPGAAGERSLVPPLVAYGVGGAALVVGIATGAVFAGRASDLKARCPNDVCKPEDEDEGDAVKTLGWVSTVSFVVAGAGAVAGTVLLLWPGGGESEATAARSLRPALRVGPGSVQLEGRF